MKKMIIGLAMMCVAGVSQALEVNGAKVFGDITATTDYVWRGVSQNDEEFSVLTQAGIEYNGFYGQGFAAPVSSTIDTGVNYELRGTLGYRGTLDSDTSLGYDFGGVYYWYQQSDTDMDFYEIFGAMSYQFDAVKIFGGINYAPDYFQTDVSNIYWHGGVDAKVFWDIHLIGKVGYSDTDKDVENITDWEITARKYFVNDSFDVAVSFFDNDADGGNLVDDIFDNRFVLSAAFHF